MISHCNWTIDCDSKINDTRLKIDRAAKLTARTITSLFKIFCGDGDARSLGWFRRRSANGRKESNLRYTNDIILMSRASMELQALIIITIKTIYMAQ